MNLIRMAGLALVGFAVLIEPAFAVAPGVPGPVVGVGLPAPRSYRWCVLGRSEAFWPQRLVLEVMNRQASVPLALAPAPYNFLIR